MLSLKERLKEILINNKLLTQEQLSQALRVQKDKGGRLSDIIIGLKFVKEEDLNAALSQGLGLPLIDLKRFKIDFDVAKVVPGDTARRYQVIPVSKMGDTITLAMADPLNIFVIDHIGALTGLKINPIIASSREIMQAIESSFPETESGALEDLVKEMSSSIEFIKEEKEVLPNDKELDRIARDTPVIKVTNMILEDAVKHRASDILIEPQDKSMRLRLRIDGTLREMPAPPRIMHNSIVSRIKVLSDLNIAEHRLPQDGRLKANISGREIDFRISVLPSSFGEKVAVRILDKTQATLDIERLGFSSDVVSKMKNAAGLPHGMFLVCGPTGSGKTTTLYSILKFVDSPEKNIVTVEDPVEFQLEGINQVTINPGVGLTFALALRSILRQDPNVIMVGEIRDFETVDIAVKSALTGHLVLSTLHTTTASGSIARLINMGIEPYLINSSLVCVVAQRLVRKICSSCKEEYLVKKDILSSLKIKVPDGYKFYRGKGCPACSRSGFSGRMAIAEVLLLTPGIRELILKRAQEHQIKAYARQEGMKTLREEALQASLQGLTTLEEVIRVTAADE